MKVEASVSCIEFDGNDAMTTDTQEEYKASHRDVVVFSSHPSKIGTVVLTIPHLKIPAITMKVKDVYKALEAAAIAHKMEPMK